LGRATLEHGRIPVHALAPVFAVPALQLLFADALATLGDMGASSVGIGPGRRGFRGNETRNKTKEDRYTSRGIGAGRDNGADRAASASSSLRSLRTLLPRLLSYVRPHAALMTVGLLLTLATNAAFLAFPFLTGQLVNEITDTDTWIIEGVGSLSLALIVVLAVRAVLKFGASYSFIAVANRVSRDVRGALYRQLLALPMGFYDEHRAGELVSRIANDVSKLEEAASNMLADFLRQAVVLLAGLVMIFVLTPQLSGFMLAIVPGIVLVVTFLGRYIRRRARDTQDELAETNTIVDETVQAIGTVKAFANEPVEGNRYHSGLDRVLRRAMQTGFLRSSIGSLIGFLVMGSMVAVIWYGSTLVDAGVLGVGDLVTFILYTGFIGGSIAGLGGMVTRLQRVIGATERVVEIVEEETELPVERIVAPVHIEPPAFTHSLKFQGVRFCYPARPDIPVIDGIELEVARGERIALVGPSGSGKSTLFRLLLRFYEPDAGRILLDGRDVREFELRAYRRVFALVPQEVMLFGGTIGENIAYGKPDSTEEEVRRVAAAANVLEFVDSFPDGMDTLVGERGVQLSGGQRQRVAIARAMLRDPQVLLLDEATSSLDAESEYYVQAALRRLMEDRTTFVIAHRLGTVRYVDRVAVVRAGRIVESGPHDTLLGRDDGAYRRLVELQLAGEVE